MDLEEFGKRALAAQRAVDEVLSPHQQDRERAADGTFRVRCTRCANSVSSPSPVALIVRAVVYCPECVEAGAVSPPNYRDLLARWRERNTLQSNLCADELEALLP